MAPADRISGEKLPMLLAALAAGATMAEAAKTAGMSERSAYRRLASDPELRRDLAERRRQLVEVASARLADLADDAIETLAALMGDAEAPASVRLAACRCVLEHAAKLGAFAEAGDVGERLDRLEELVLATRRAA